VLVCAPTGKAVDEALAEGAGDDGLTVAKALSMIERHELDIDRSTVVVVDEASMVGTADLRKLLACATRGRAKIVLVGDAFQLAPVKARGGMFEQLCAELPWSQRLSAVWRMRDPDERAASLALRSARGNRLRTAVGWYRTADRLHTGDPIAMAADALAAYEDSRRKGRNALLVCDTWDMADALNRRLHDAHKSAAAPVVRAVRGQEVAVGDLIMSRTNDSTIALRPGNVERTDGRIDQVRNGNRWRVIGVDPSRNRLAAERLGDGARAVFDGDYVGEHVTLGYAATVHAAQGVTADDAYALMGEHASRAMAYVAMTRGRNANHAFIYQRITAERDSDHTAPVVSPEIHTLRRGNAYSAAHYFRQILANDARPQSMHTVAERTPRDVLPDVIADLLDRNAHRRSVRRAAWRDSQAASRNWRSGYERAAASAAASDLDGAGLGL
jgi:ATP-dependent exoDNAse (exonuclease V) alpha subunit